ncbi:hypothetical protein JCM30471_11380 [Desulfuromonas carbonis]|uniref:tetratricopeptide repeat protein n=1 Tax=Desulfuromonas sp. DDH964 TaxID=1823759 RepID=UPI00078EB1F5|nr:tetratricopeptide repeat protein [Desulfuromonas sp. DDH964]AMV72621.1 hypothetical protein DBW_2282 [Desulfuromonas sp. DDH964]
MSNKEKLLASAQKYLAKGQVARAIKDYQKIVELDPRDVRNRQKLAELYSRDNHPAEAVEAYEGVAKHYAENGFYLKAIAVYKQMQKLEPTRVSIYHRLAELNEKQGLVGNALAEYRSLVAYYEKNGMLPEAINVLQKMRELEPENLNIRVKIAETFASGGLKEKAREEFLEILNLLHQKQDFARILKLYELFLPRFNGDIDLEIGQAETLIAKGDIDQGLDNLKGLLKKAPDSTEILLVLAHGYHSREDFENERLTYQHLLKNAPDELEFREGYIRACLNQGDSPRALDELEDWKETFFAAGKVALLKEFYERLKDAHLDDDRVMKTLHSIYELTGEGEKLFALISAMPAAVDGFDTGSENEEGEEILDGSILEEAVEDLEELETIDEIEPPQDVPDLDQAATEAELTQEVAEEAQEIPLEFLEGVGELVFDDPVIEDEPVAADAVPTAGEEGTVAAEDDLELELELDLELDEELQPVAEEVDAPSLETLSPLEELEPVTEVAMDEETGFAEVELELEEDALLPAEPEPESGPESEPEAIVEPDAETLAKAAAQAIRADLEEAEFYFQQGLYDDATRVLGGLLATAPDCAEAHAKLADIRTLVAAQTVAEEAPPEAPAGDYFDLAGELRAEAEGPVAAERGEGAPGFQFDGSLASGAGEGVDQIDLEDAESHYNLGIAYKEMGLTDDAIVEFDKAARSPARALDAITLKGICLVEKGEHAEAEQTFIAGLGRLRLSKDEAASLRYELGLLYQDWQRPQQALEAFEAVAAEDHFYRDVGEKVAALRAELGVVDGESAGSAAANGKKNRVSYL